MNATSLYVSTCRLVMQGDVHNSSWTDLYRLLPYLRQSLSCTVCQNLLIEPYTPSESKCQHHVCKLCRGGKKKLKPSCSWCKDYNDYYENIQLRILLQCFKKLCEYMCNTLIYGEIQKNVTNGCNELTDIIHEGAGLQDDYKSSFGLSKSAYSILPCVFTPTASAATQTMSNVHSPSTRGTVATQAKNAVPASNSLEPTNNTVSETTSNSGNVFSQANMASKAVTVKKKKPNVSFRQNSSDSVPQTTDAGSDGNQASSPQPFKKLRVKHPKHPKPKRKGCRCGNATATPGKLTCCGQRCPCYVEAKACIDCRCRGCRNPHRPGGKKVRPIITEIELNLQKSLVANYKLENKAKFQALVSYSAHDAEISEDGVASEQAAQESLGVPPRVLSTASSKSQELTQGNSVSVSSSPSLNYLVSHTSSLYSTHPPLFVEPVEDVPTTLLVDDEKSDSENSDVDIDV